MNAETDAQAAARDATDGPSIWLLLGDKLGDNAQARIIADGLGWSYELRTLTFLPQYQLGKPPFKASLYHIDQDKSDRLEAPWPDLIITVGRRPSMAALWVQEQSGGHTRIVLIGRPKRMLERFALVVATPQYGLPPADNVVAIDLPLMRPNREAIGKAAEAWRDRFETLQKPVTALLVGGPTKPFVLNRAVAGQLMDQAIASIQDSPGTLYVSTSRRTPAEVVEALRERMPEGGHFFEWKPDAQDNPYLPLMGLADRFIVTGDSISMMVEVARMGKPLAIFGLPERSSPWVRLRQSISRRLFQRSRQRGGEGGGRLADLLYKTGFLGFARDLTAVHQALYDLRLAVPLGKPFLPPGEGAGDEAPKVVARIHALFQGRKHDR